MRKLLSANRLTVLTLIVIAGLSGAADLKNSSAAEANTIRIEAGQTLEIGTDTASPKSEFSWILTKDRKFQSAQRTKFFQTRLAEPGTYVLDVSVQDPVTSENGYRAFTIVVTDPTGNVPTPAGAKDKPLSAVLQTDPPTVNGSAYVAPEGGILKIDPSGSDGNIATYHIDLDTSVDSDQDGNPANDIDNVGTLSEKSGTPIYVFMLPKQTERKVVLTVSDLNSVEPKTAELPVLFAPAPVQSSTGSTPVSNPNSPILMQKEGAVVHFSATMDASQTNGKELLYEWDFGDRVKSLLYAPVHEYTAAGTYTVALTIRDISNAQVMYEGTDTIVIDDVFQSSSSSAGNTSSSSSSGTTGTKSGASLKGILQVSFIILLLLAFAIGLYVLFTWIKRKTATGLQKTLEKMEGTIVNKDEKVSTDAKPVPMKLKKETPKSDESIAPDMIIEREQSKQDFKTQERSNETPVAGSGPVPSWLAKAATKPSSITQDAVISTPTPAPVVSPKPAPAPSAAPAPTAAAPVQDAPVPAWLKPAPAQTPAPVVTSTPVTAPAPAPKAAPAPTPPAPKVAPPPPIPPKAPDAPKPQPKPNPAPVPAPASTPKPAPPTPTPTPVQAKAPEAPKPQPKPNPAPVPVPTPAPKPVSQPIPQATPVQQEKNIPKDDDTPIAIIQADSISKQ